MAPEITREAFVAAFKRKDKAETDQIFRAAIKRAPPFLHDRTTDPIDLQ